MALCVHCFYLIFSLENINHCASNSWNGYVCVFECVWRQCVCFSVENFPEWFWLSFFPQCSFSRAELQQRPVLELWTQFQMKLGEMTTLFFFYWRVSRHLLIDTHNKPLNFINLPIFRCSQMLHNEFECIMPEVETVLIRK